MASYEPKKSAVATSAEWKQSWSAPKAAPGSEEPWTAETPIWHVVVRGFQIFFGLIIAGLAGYLIHGYLMNAVAFGLVCSLFTWIICIWSLVSEKVLSARKAYNIWATLSLDLFMVILWLASMGANAANRATFTVNVNVEGCYDDGSSISAHHCTIVKRGTVVKRVAVASKGGLAMMSGIAGLSAVQMLLFVATFAYNAHNFRLYYQANKGPKATHNPGALEMNAQHTPILNAQQGGPAPPSYPQYTDQQAYQSQVPVQQPVEQYQPTPTTSPAPAPIPTPSPQPYPYGHPDQQYPAQQAPAQYAPAHHPPQQYAEAPGHTPVQVHTPAQYPQATQSYSSNPHEMPSHSQGYSQPTSFPQ